MKVKRPRRVQLSDIYLPHLPEIKRTFRLQVDICNPGNKYELLYRNPRDRDIKMLSVNDAANIPFVEPTDVCGDIFFRLMHRGRNGNDKLICRFGIHTSFLKLRE